MSKRQNIIALICGNRGVGKSTWIIESIKKTAHKKVLIYDIDDNEMYHQFQAISPDMLPRWKKGVKRIIDVDVDHVLEEIAEHVNNAYLILEDATKYIEGNPPESVRRLVLASKQRNLDIIFTFHTYRSIPPKLISWADSLLVCKTGEDIRQFKSKIPLFSKVAKVHAEVEKHPSRYFKKTVRLR